MEIMAKLRGDYGAARRDMGCKRLIKFRKIYYFEEKFHKKILRNDLLNVCKDANEIASSYEHVSTFFFL
jgi:hypothetical protein